MRQVLRKNMLSGTGLLIAVALFLAVNIISNLTFTSSRLDLTEDKLYTLSQGTRNILSALEEPVTLRLYLSQALAANLPGIKSYAIRVKELLQEYQRRAGGKIHLSVIDPEPFSEAEDRAVGYGLQGIPVEGGSATFYFGLVGTSSTEEEEVIAFFQPEREEFLEYDITKLVYRLSHPEQPVIGLLSTLPLQGAGQGRPMPPQAGAPPWMIYNQMDQLFTIRTLAKDLTTIPAEVDILMLVHPKGLSDTALYAIDQFMLRGGRALVFADPYAEGEQTQAGRPPVAAQGAPRHSELGPLLDAWGIKLATDKVVGDLQGAKRIRYNRDGRMQVSDYPVWIDIPAKQLNKEDIVTAELDTLTLASAGILQQRNDSGTEFIPLIRSGAKATRFDTSRMAMIDPQGLLSDFEPQGQFTLAARITGELHTAFPQGPPPAAEDSDQDAAPAPSGHIDRSTRPANLIVVADSDMLRDRFWVQVQNFIGQRIALPTSGNGNFVINALDNLSGSNDLISVRSRGDYTRPFTRVREIQQQAEQRFRKKEQELRTRLRETEQKIQQLQQQRQDGNALILSEQQQQEIARFREEKVRIRKELRDVRHRLRKDIERLETRLKFINIGLVPLLIAIGGIIAGLYRMRRRQSNTG